MKKFKPLIMKPIFLTFFILCALAGVSQKKKSKTQKQYFKKSDDFFRENVVKEFVPDKIEISYSEKVEPNFNEQLVIQEIALLLDSIREYMYEKKVLKTNVNPTGNKGVQHHNRYLRDFVNPSDQDMSYLNHYEIKKDGISYYNGKDTLICDWVDRM